MDPVYSATILNSSHRQSIEPGWPPAPRDREMVTWSSPADRERAGWMRAALHAFGNLLVQAGERLRHPATSSPEMEGRAQ